MRFQSLVQFASVVTLSMLAACICGPQKKPEPMKPAPVREVEAPAPAPRGPCPEAPYVEDGMTVISVAYPTGNASSSLICLQKSGPERVTAGEPFEYRIRVTNLTGDAIPGVVVTDRMPEGFQMENASPAAEDGRWRFASLGGNETQTIVVRGMATRDGTLTNCADVMIEPQEVCVDTAVSTPMVEITKEGPGEVLACDPITYRIVVRNTGTGMARGLTVRDSLPDGLTANGEREVTMEVGDLEGGATRELTLTAQAAGTGTYTNSATVSGAQGVNATSNSVTTRVVKPSLTLALDCPNRAFLGKNVTYTLNVTNDGDTTCADTMVEASLPGGTSFVDASEGGAASGGAVRWTIAELAPGTTRTLTMRVSADQLGPKTVNASASCVCAERVEATCTTEIQGIPAVLLEVVDIEDPIQVGNSETYEITVTNQGSATDTNIRIVCELEDQMEYVGADGATTATASGSTVTFEALPSLAAKAKATWRVTVRATGAGDVRFKVTMNTDQLGRPVEETEATNFYE